MLCLGNHPPNSLTNSEHMYKYEEHSRSSVSLMFGRRPISDGRLPQPPVHHRTSVKYIIVYITYIILQTPPVHQRTHLPKRCLILQTVTQMQFIAKIANKPVKKLLCFANTNCKSLPFFYFLTFKKADCPIFALSVGWSVDATVNFFNIYRHKSPLLTQ